MQDLSTTGSTVTFRTMEGLSMKETMRSQTQVKQREASIENEKPRELNADDYKDSTKKHVEQNSHQNFTESQTIYEMHRIH